MSKLVIGPWQFAKPDPFGFIRLLFDDHQSSDSPQNSRQVVVTAKNEPYSIQWGGGFRFLRHVGIRSMLHSFLPHNAPVHLAATNPGAENPFGRALVDIDEMVLDEVPDAVGFINCREFVRRVVDSNGQEPLISKPAQPAARVQPLVRCTTQSRTVISPEYIW